MEATPAQPATSHQHFWSYDLPPELRQKILRPRLEGWKAIPEKVRRRHGLLIEPICSSHAKDATALSFTCKHLQKCLQVSQQDSKLFSSKKIDLMKPYGFLTRFLRFAPGTQPRQYPTLLVVKASQPHHLICSRARQAQTLHHEEYDRDDHRWSMQSVSSLDLCLAEISERLSWNLCTNIRHLTIFCPLVLLPLNLMNPAKTLCSVSEICA